MSQRPIAIHALEHRGGTDQGVSKFRHTLRQGIKTVASGAGVDHPAPGAAGLIPTYVNDTVLHIPPQQAENDEQDSELLKKVGDEIVDAVVSDDYLYEPQREKIIEDKHFSLEKKYQTQVETIAET